MRCAVKAILTIVGDVLDQKHFDSIATRVAELLRRERLRQELSMSAVAERGGLSQQMVSYVERGLRKPNLDTLLRISAALKLAPADLLAEAMAPNRKRR